MSTWQPPGGAKPAKNRWLLIPIVVIAAVPMLWGVFGIGYLLLRYNNIAFVDGPTRNQVTHTAQDLLTKTVATVNPPPTLGKPDPAFGPCGRLDGLGPVRYTGGIDVSFSGVAPTDHQKIEDQVTTQGELLARKLKGRWLVTVGWDSPTSTTGSFHAFLSCTEIAD